MNPREIKITVTPADHRYALENALLQAGWRATGASCSGADVGELYYSPTSGSASQTDRCVAGGSDTQVQDLRTASTFEFDGHQWNTHFPNRHVSPVAGEDRVCVLTTEDVKRGFSLVSMNRADQHDWSQPDHIIGWRPVL